MFLVLDVQKKLSTFCVCKTIINYLGLLHVHLLNKKMQKFCHQLPVVS